MGGMCLAFWSGQEGAFIHNGFISRRIKYICFESYRILHTDLVIPLLLSAVHPPNAPVEISGKA